MDTVIVTGASTGLGLETAVHLARSGFRVFATIRDDAHREGVLRVAEEQDAPIEIVHLDLTDQESIAQAVRTVVEASGGVYGLVNNAGIGLRGCFEDLTDREIRDVFEANVFGTMAVTRQVLPYMREARRGRVITITSVGGRIGTYGLSAYCSTKFAQEGFGESLALEVAHFGIKSILVEPGMIKTPRWTFNRGTAANALDPRSAYAEMFRRHESLADRHVNSRRTTPEDVAKVVHRALTDDRPRLRYVVGRPASLVLSLRRHLPGELFERLYFRGLLRRIQREPLPAGPKA
ncbi:MAG: SDR family oxidoreductase [Isosphaeraceae bacterium]